MKRSCIACLFAFPQEVYCGPWFRALNHSCSMAHASADAAYRECRRSSSLKWVAVNCALLAVLACDLWNKCPGYTSASHYAEAVAALVLLANALQHLRRAAAPARAPAAPRAPAAAARASPPREEPASLSLSPRRWRGEATPPPSPPSRGSPAAPEPPRERDEFIADRRDLAEYIRAYERRESAEAPRPAWVGAAGPCARRAYQLAAPDDAGDGAAPDDGEARSPQPWRRLRLDPRHLERWNFNLRLWLHVTILAPLARELERAEAAGAAAAAAAPTEARERATAAAPALLPYLQPFADQRYVAQRIKELAGGGCLSAYRWNGGGAEWDDAKPTDAELVLHLLGAYVDGQLAGGARGFCAQHVSAAPAPPPRGAGALAVHRCGARPPHYVLVLGDDTLEAARGRNNLLHTLLLLLAAAAARRPPHLCRLPLGPAGLNMLWIIDR